MSLREDQVEMAVRFLSNDKVLHRPQTEKESFLTNKGLTQEEIAEAFKRSEKGSTLSEKDSSVASAVPAPAATTPAATSQAAAAPAATSRAAVAPPAAPQAPQPPPAALPAPPVPQYPNSADHAAAAWQVPPYAQMQMPPPWAYQGYAPPQEPASEGGAWWAWLLGGLGAGLAGTLLVNPLRSRFEDASSSQAPGQTLGPAEAALVSKPPATQEVTSNGHSAGTGGEPDGKASYEELLVLLRQQSEEARENAAMCAKALQTTQEQHQKMFAEMHKALQAATQHSKKPQPTELSASTIQSLATMIREAGPTDSAPTTVSTSSPAAPPTVQAPATAPVMAPAPAAAAVPLVPAAQVPPPAVPAADAAGVTPNVPLSLRESFDAINSSLQRLVAESNTKAEAVKSMNTVAMVLGNLLKDPTSDRNRKVNTSSARFSEIFRNEGAASELLKLGGFQYQAPNFTFGTDGQVATEGVQRVLDLLQEAQRGIDQAWAARVPAAENIVASPAGTASDEALRPPTAARPWARDVPARAAAPAAPWPGQTRPDMQTVDDGSQHSSAAVSSSGGVLPNSSTPSASSLAALGQAPAVMAPAAVPVAASATSMAGAVAHPAESLPRAMAHPAESEARAPAPQLLASAEAAGSSAATMVQQAQPPQQMRLPIAHPAEVPPVTAAHPAESHPAEGMAPAHPAETPPVHPAEAAMPAGTSPAHPAESSGASVSDEPQSGG
eukprot:TRINITY_DN22571_c0_g5_i1.p1 TRINITY_DN22571_c0_g5~~TRINITY_DN22571_c0_g5_i1.p1  ORF type:complete len:724 (+),score=159.27 TRINITY_DN22571_c0_g5_i1:84-2255(+)